MPFTQSSLLSPSLYAYLAHRSGPPLSALEEQRLLEEELQRQLRDGYAEPAATPAEPAATPAEPIEERLRRQDELQRQLRELALQQLRQQDAQVLQDRVLEAAKKGARVPGLTSYDARLRALKTERDSLLEDDAAQRERQRVRLEELGGSYASPASRSQRVRLEELGGSYASPASRSQQQSSPARPAASYASHNPPPTTNTNTKTLLDNLTNNTNNQTQIRINELDREKQLNIEREELIAEQEKQNTERQKGLDRLAQELQSVNDRRRLAARYNSDRDRQQQQRAQEVTELMSQAGNNIDKLKPHAMNQFIGLQSQLQKIKESNLQPEEQMALLAGNWTKAKQLSDPGNWREHAPLDIYEWGGKRFQVDDKGMHKELGISNPQAFMESRSSYFPLRDAQGQLHDAVPGMLNSKGDFVSYGQLTAGDQSPVAGLREEELQKLREILRGGYSGRAY